MMRSKRADLEYDAECLATFAKDVEGEAVSLQIAELDEDIEIIVENTEGSVQYILDSNNRFQVSEIVEENIMNEVLDVLEKSNLCLADVITSPLKNTDPFLYINDVEHLLERNFVPFEFDSEELSVYLSALENCADLSLTSRSCDDSFKMEAIKFGKCSENDSIINEDEISLEESDITYTDDSDLFEDITYLDEEFVNRDENKENVEAIVYIKKSDLKACNKVTLKKSISKKKSWSCKSCQFKSWSNRLLAKHQKTHSPVKSAIKKLQCRLCNRMFGRSTTYNTHLSKCLINSRRKSCPYCIKIFHDICNYQRHLIFHLNRRYTD